MRENPEEVDLGKFVVSHGTPTDARDGDEVTGHSWDGLVVPDPEHPNCLCKESRNRARGTRRYFVKFSVAGVNAGRMVDPNDDQDLARRGDWTANGRFEFRPVEQAAYDLYLRFIKTGNPAYRLQAERAARV